MDRAKNLIKAKKNPIDSDTRNSLEAVEVLQPSVGNIKTKIIKAEAIKGEASGFKKVYKLRDDNTTTFTSVEQVALKHYSKNGYPNGVHCEGSLIVTLFCVLFWDIIYDETIPDVFVTEMQYLPFDLYTSDFYKNRQESIVKRLKDIESDWEINEMENFMKEIWEQHSYKRSLIVMSMLDTDALIIIFQCIGRKRLGKIFHRLVKSLKDFSAGMPDLFVWNQQNLEVCIFW